MSLTVSCLPPLNGILQRFKCLWPTSEEILHTVQSIHCCTWKQIIKLFVINKPSNTILSSLFIWFEFILNIYHINSLLIYSNSKINMLFGQLRVINWQILIYDAPIWALTFYDVNDTEAEQGWYMICGSCVNCDGPTHAVSNNHDRRRVLSIEHLHHFANVPFDRLIDWKAMCVQSETSRLRGF